MDGRQSVGEPPADRSAELGCCAQQHFGIVRRNSGPHDDHVVNFEIHRRQLVALPGRQSHPLAGGLARHLRVAAVPPGPTNGGLCLQNCKLHKFPMVLREKLQTRVNLKKREKEREKKTFNESKNEKDRKRERETLNETYNERERKRERDFKRDL